MGRVNKPSETHDAARRTSSGRHRLAASTLLAFAIAGVSGCGAAPPPPVADPFEARIQRCISAPRAASDAASAAMVHIPAGAARLGSDAAERRGAAALDPQGVPDFLGEQLPRNVVLRAFRIDRTPVTAEAYAEAVRSCGVIPADPQSLPASRWAELAQRFGLRAPYSLVSRMMWDASGPRDERGAYPIVLVTQQEAAFYCAWRGARLPTADEWERASRGPRGNTFPWGSAFQSARVNTEERSRGDLTSVASFPSGASQDGVLDMGGLVYEWTSTPVAGREGMVRVKGASFDTHGGYSRGAAERAVHAEGMEPMLGFRCAHDD